MQTTPPLSRMDGASDVPVLMLQRISQRFGAGPAGWLSRSARRLGLGTAPATVHALDGVDLAVQRGEVVGLVGESGCGKSTLGRVAAGLLRPTEGTVRTLGRDPAGDRTAALAVQMIFQSPQSSLNPRMRVDRIIGEAPVVHGLTRRDEVDAYVCEQMQRVGLDPALRHRYPHQFSGGQRQRIGIARALAVQPTMLVCDEAVAALDVSIQAQILNLFLDLRESLGLTYLFISHDLRVVQHLCDRVVIMYLGRVVESAPVDELFAHARHPYTRALLAEIPDLRQRRKVFASIQGEIPSPLAPPPGCHFHPRCPHAMSRCRTEVPLLRAVDGQHLSACHLDDDVQAPGTSSPPTSPPPTSPSTSPSTPPTGATP